jgi:hypothetical protein
MPETVDLAMPVRGWSSDEEKGSTVMAYTNTNDASMLTLYVQQVIVTGVGFAGCVLTVEDAKQLRAVLDAFIGGS